MSEFVYVLGTIISYFLILKMVRDIKLQLPYIIIKYGTQHVAPDGSKFWILDIGVLQLICKDVKK